MITRIFIEPVHPAANTTSQQAQSNTRGPIPMSQDKTDQANASDQTNSYQGTWVERWHPVVEVLEGDQGQPCKDDHVYDSHNEIW